MDNISLEDYKELLQKVLETVNCPVCFSILQPSVNHCANGHAICSECRVQVTECPVCRGPFTSFNNVILNDILGLLPHRCRFKGCPEFVKSTEDHEKWCGFRPTRCKRCDWIGCSRDILEHVNNAHIQECHLHGEVTQRISWQKISLVHSFNTYLPIYAHNHFFWMRVINDAEHKVFRKAFYLVPNGKLTNSFQFKFILENARNSYTICILLDKESAMNSGKEEHSFALPSSEVQRFVNNENKLFYDLYVEKLDE